MQQEIGQGRVSGRRSRESTRRNGTGPTTKEIPFDYVATFTLEGRAGNRVQEVFNISVEGAFVAVAVGYSFILDQDNPDMIDSLSIQAGEAPGALPGVLQSFVSAAAIGDAATARTPMFISPAALIQSFAAKLCGIHFRYSIVDSASGRELQNRPIHNVAGLGEPFGERPFRPLAKPMVFAPRSTIRIEVEEVSEGLLYAGAELYIVLHGYKMLGVGTALP